jgi:hypothetical membrane protein
MAMHVAHGRMTGVAETTDQRAAAGIRAAVLAGLALAVASFIILLGIITAEALYPATYTTHDNEISDLGATRPPNSIIRQPSARIFNATMLASGALIVASAAALLRAHQPKRVWITLGLMGIGVFGVGVFPGNYAPHGIFAMLAFVAGGLSAILVGTVLPAPLRYLSIAMGIATLGSLLIAMVGDLTPIWDEMGDGGVERWVAYPVVLWLGVYGGFLAGGRQAES